MRTTSVAVDPATAFEVFTERIDAWWQPGAYSWHDAARAVGKRFEPWVGGRFVEVWDRATGEGYDEGRILVWEPGRRLVFTFRALAEPEEPETEVDVRFEPEAGGTRVTLEHRGLDRLSPARAERRRSGKGFGIMLGWFGQYLAKGASMPVEVGLVPNGPEAPAQLWLGVPDVQAAAARVRALGGEASDPKLSPSGWSSDCRDDQGTRFSIWHPAARYE